MSKCTETKTAIVRLWPSKILFDVMNPDPKLIRMEDVVHSTAHICRYTGHVRYFYSVLQHQMQVALIIRHLGGSETDQFIGLNHDDSEYVCNDLSSPLKDNLEVYRDIEDTVQGAFAVKLGFPYPYPEIVHTADLIARNFEANLLKDANETVEPLPRYITEDISSPRWEPTRPENLRREFMKRFVQLGGKLDD